MRRDLAIVALLAAVAGFLLALSGVWCLDVWFHLRTGQIIWETGRIPTVDVLSHTRAGRPWITHEWGFELPLYLWHRLAGDGGLVFVKAALAAATGALLVRACVRAGAAVDAAGVAAVAGLAVAASRFMVRPHMASAVLTAGLLGLGFGQLRNPGRRAWLAVPVAALWANLHAGVVIGIGVLGAFALDEAWRLRRPGRLAAVTLAAAGAALLNPHGWRVFWYPFWLVRANNQGLFRILELDPPRFPSPVHGLAVAVLLLGLVGVRRLGPAAWALAAAGAWMGLTRSRGSLDFALLSAPVAAVGLTALLGRWRRPAAVLPALALAAALAALRWEPRLDVDRANIPERAMAFVERAGLHGNLYNSHVFGSWITWAWPDIPVFIDGRNEVYMDLFREMQVSPMADLTRRYDLGFAVVAYPQRDVREEVEVFVDVADQLVADPDWVLVHFDDVARVYALDRPDNAEAIARWGYRLLRPGWEDLSYIARSTSTPEERAAFEAEARRAIAESPDSRVARLHYAEFLRLVGRRDEALAELDRCDPDDPFVLGRKGAVLLESARPDEAVPFLLAALDREPDNPNTWNNLGLARLRTGDLDGAVAAFRRSLAIDDRQLPALRNLALALRRAGREDEAAGVSARADDLAGELSRQAFETGQRLLRAGLTERAAVEFQRAAELRPQAVNAWYMLGVCLNVLGQSDEAERALRATLRLDPNHPFARLELGRALLDLGRRDEARAALEAFLAQGPEPRWADKARALLGEAR